MLNLSFLHLPFFFVFLTDRLRFKYMLNFWGLWAKCGRRGVENSHRGRKKAAATNPGLRQSRKAANVYRFT